MKSVLTDAQPSYIVWLGFTRARLYFAALPLWAKIILIFGSSRLLGYLLFMLVGRQQIASPWGEGPTSYLNFISFWDAGWYEQIANGGYPRVLPLDSAGSVAENPWAFLPLFPYTAQLISTLLRIEYFPAASGLALFSGFCAAFAVYYLFYFSLKLTSYSQNCIGGADTEDGAVSAESDRESCALWGLAAVAYMPVAPILQVPYAEAYNLFFLALTLFLLMRRRWWLAALIGLFACLSRPVGVPLGAAAGLYWFFTFLKVARSGGAAASSLSTRWSAALVQTRSQLLSALVICAEALLWPAIAWWRTGRIDAYTATETAWRGTHLAPVMPWIKQGEEYFGVFGIPVLIVLVLGFSVLLTSATVKKTLHPALVLWCASYAAYLLIFLNPQSSLFRMLLPLFPLCLPLVTISASQAYRFLLLLAGAALQFGWIGWLWHWKQLPGGGDYPP